MQLGGVGGGIVMQGCMMTAVSKGDGWMDGAKQQIGKGAKRAEDLNNTVFRFNEWM